MAISHAQPLLLSLLVSLFFLPSALGGTDFHNCNPLRSYPVKVKIVEISPDPVKVSTNGNITITGSTSVDIPDGATINLDLRFPEPISKRSYSLCDIVACPVAAGPIVLNFYNVFTQQELTPWGYFVLITITEEHQEDPMMCVSFRCRITREQTSLL
ncbi:MD-2-related lipid recognition domain-containing protein [Raphanus sativus]|uniref:MD-2-related lipid-recognition protein ROSY1-like n=1 Tax=Raphanus sativus TaxID=3726 RepID=A0A6J0NVU1_RAPSA|nr:MD-2-related lipid-recognition protein ROSY1-like [Raphanus sativus]KAJ4897935.1 MD-2-related lipid recognition domain-containing protein [Raphanus sativus]